MKLFARIGAILAVALAVALGGAGTAVAKHGADDPPAHHHGRHHHHKHHHHHHHGAEHGPNHQ
jgi:hypothetical protein